ncbi:threonine dehydratase I [Paxillus ammoniavirescens]|nr:threonine dehydratase I [Paxillus ammoniavirescens]
MLYEAPFAVPVASAAGLVEYASSAPLPVQNYSLPPEARLADAGDVDLQLIEDAAKVLEQIRPLPLTPLFYAPVLSETFKCKVFLKREDLQQVFSFKIRGAYNCMSNLNADERKNGVVTASAGNHAQGVAYSSNHLKIHAKIYMPVNTPEIKISSVKRLGGAYVEVVLVGNDFDEAKKAAEDDAQQNHKKFVPPFDNKFVIAGQGTIALEIVDQVKQAKKDLIISQDYADAIFAPIGGGGLISGITAYINLTENKSHTKPYGAGGIASRSMYESLKAGKVVEVPTVDLFPDGTAVRQVGALPFAICQKYLQLDNIYNEITTDDICAAIQDIFDETRSIAEPSGALGLAALKQHLSKIQPKSDQVFVAVISGANMDFEMLRFVSERAELGAKKEAILSVKFDEPLNNFPEIIKLVQTRPNENKDPRNITELVFRHNSPGNGHAVFSFNINPNTEKDLTPEGRQKAQTDEVIKQLKDSSVNFVGESLNTNLVALDHVRYMVGGRAQVERERLVSFTFPERPGSLKKFLELLEEVNAPLESDSELSLSLFHYRFHGGDVVHVLVGVQVPKESDPTFNEFLLYLENNGFNSVKVTDDQAYQDFLGKQ